MRAVDNIYIFHVQNLRIEATSHEYFGELRFRYKCVFDYKGNKYTNISLTDPIYRDISQDGLNLEDALIIASLPCVPYSDGSFYKFVAKIIPIDKNLASYMETKNKEIIVTIDVYKTQSLPSPFVKYDLAVKAQQTPGVVMFENYDQLKTSISNGVPYYSNFEYTLDNYQLALKHHNELKHVKNALEKTKREIVKSYNAPLETVEKRIEELINLIKVPFKKLDTFIKQNEKESKKYEILKFAKAYAISNGLQKHLDNIIDSPAFFDAKWLNASCLRSTWKSAIILKIGNAVKDIGYILSLQTDNIPSILAHYYQTLSIDRVKVFIDSLQRAAVVSEELKPNVERSNAPKDIYIIPVQPKDIDEEREVESSKIKILPVDINLDDLEILSHVANSINPYTGELITGIDDSLRERLFDIIQNIKQSKVQRTKESSTINSKKGNASLNELASSLSNFAKEKAAQEGVAYWKILRRKAIDSLCKHLPVLKEELYSKHVLLGKKAKEKYGGEITKIIRDFINSDNYKDHIIEGVLEEASAQVNIFVPESRIGKPWTKEEENKLIEEFNRGLKISDIAKLHNRNNGGIRARLKRLDLIE